MREMRENMYCAKISTFTVSCLCIIYLNFKGFIITLTFPLDIILFMYHLP